MAVPLPGTGDGRIVHTLSDHLTGKEGGRNACAPVCLFRTRPCRERDDELQAFPSGILKTSPLFPEMKCLCLSAGAGMLQAWNSHKQPGGHKTIPLFSEHFIEALRQGGLP
jgi:hypothetical protein